MSYWCLVGRDWSGAEIRRFTAYGPATAIDYIEYAAIAAIIAAAGSSQQSLSCWSRNLNGIAEPACVAFANMPSATTSAGSCRVRLLPHPPLAYEDHGRHAAGPPCGTLEEPYLDR